MRKENEQELVKLAYEAVTLTSPTDQMVQILAYVGIKRTLEILLIMQQSPHKVKKTRFASSIVPIKVQIP